MKRCFELARLGLGYAAPNPLVGAVLVHQGRIIGEGWHRQYGQAHAEINCLDNVPHADRALIPDSTMYVSLEPCAHHGKTPPCALRLVEESVKEVVICNVDPYKAVAGKGIEILEQAGISTTAGILSGEGLWLNRRFFCYVTARRPYIILKWAQTNEGFFAPVNRTRFQMSNEHSKQLLHKWRTEEAAIMVGHATATVDNPLLTSRLWKGRQPLRVALDKRLALPATHRLFNNEAPTWIINEQEQKTEGNVLYVKETFDEILLTRITQSLYNAGIQSLIVEGGATVLQSFINANLWDEARVFQTGSLLRDGLRAPDIREGDKVFQTTVGSDQLHLYTQAASPYKYISGMEL